jgi:hypothetical protein
VRRPSRLAAAANFQVWGERYGDRVSAAIIVYAEAR